MLHFAYHLLVIGRGGFPLFEVFLSVLDLLSVDTVRESTVTLASWINCNKVIWSAFRVGGVPPTSADCWGSTFGLNTNKTLRILFYDKMI